MWWQLGRCRHMVTAGTVQGSGASGPLYRRTHGLGWSAYLLAWQPRAFSSPSGAPELERDG